MGAGQRSNRRAGLLALSFLFLARTAWPQPLPEKPLVPLAVVDGQCECVLATPHAENKFLLVLGSLATAAGPFRVTIDAQASDQAIAIPVQDSSPDESWTRQVQALHTRLVRSRPAHSFGEDYPPSDSPPARRVFSIFVREKDFQNPESYVSVTGHLQATGQHCQVYLDGEHPNPGELRPTIQDIVQTFDETIYPRACQSLGHALDVDRDGRFTILMTGWVGKLCNGKVSLGGFVRGSDFYRDLAAPFGNRCDMMYLNTNLQPGPHLRTLLAHEYTHALIFSEHVFGDYVPDAPRQDEESWLNEGLAHLAEDMHGFSWSNLDYRISAFLSAPERYALVVPDYYGAGLWRSHGSRGAAYLFLRWCADQIRPDLPGRLIRTNLVGLANLEAATEKRFADLFRHWSVALALSGSNLAEPVSPFRRVDPRQPLAGRLLCGPRYLELPLAGGHVEIQLNGTSVAYLLLHSPTGDCSRVAIRAGADAALQATLIPLPEQTARLGLRAEPGQLERSARLVLTAYDHPVRLEEAAWERLVPRGNFAQDTSYRPNAAPGQSIQDWFGDPALKPGESRTSGIIALPFADGPNDAVIVKVAARDQAGHRLAAWTVVPLAAPAK